MEDEAYYYVYIELDDEDGKYISAETVTFTKASVLEESKTWFLFLYGESSFSWDGLDTTSSDSSDSDDGKDDGKEEDNTVANTTSLPQTGDKKNLVTIAILAIIGIIAYFRLKTKYKDIR